MTAVVSENYYFVQHDAVAAYAEGSSERVKANKMGFPIVMDFFTQMAIEQRIFQIRAGDIATPLVGDVPIADAAAEMCADAPSGLTIIPVHVVVGITLAPGTANMVKVQSVGAVSTGGTAFVPLNLYKGGRVATSTGRVQAVGAVTVAAETATTTRLHYATGSGIAQGAYTLVAEWIPKAPPVLVGPSCCYVQIGGTGTAPSYFANLEYIELSSDAVA